LTELVSDPEAGLTSETQLPWTQPEWRAAAEAWIRERAEITGEIEQPHAYPWSTVLRVPAADGALYFKAVAPIHRFEVALTCFLGELRPGWVTEVVAAVPERGWMLMRDAGTRLRELIAAPADLHHWEVLLPRYAELQLAAAPHADALLALGVPDFRLGGLPELLGAVLADREALLLDDPEGLTAAEYARLREAEPDFAALCRELAGFGIPETIQHDDLHDGNVFVRNGRYALFDWGDSSVSHPFHTLTVTLRALAWKLKLQPAARELYRLRNAYLEPFGALGTASELRAAADLAYRTGTVARALAWHRYLQAREPGLRSDDAEAVPYGLRLFLANGPIGTWE
jgi:Phosphotransferase enzyme family